MSRDIDRAKNAVRAAQLKLAYAESHLAAAQRRMEYPLPPDRMFGEPIIEFRLRFGGGHTEYHYVALNYMSDLWVTTSERGVYKYAGWDDLVEWMTSGDRRLVGDVYDVRASTPIHGFRELAVT